MTRKTILVALLGVLLLAGGGARPVWAQGQARRPRAGTAEGPWGRSHHHRPSRRPGRPGPGAMRGKGPAGQRRPAGRASAPQGTGRTDETRPLPRDCPPWIWWGTGPRSRDPSFALDSTFGSGGGFGIPDGSPDWFNEWLMGFGSIIPAADAIPAQSFLRTTLNLNWTINPVKIMGAVGAANLGIDRQDLAIASVRNSTVESTVAAYHQHHPGRRQHHRRRGPAGQPARTAGHHEDALRTGHGHPAGYLAGRGWALANLRAPAEHRPGRPGQRGRPAQRPHGAGSRHPP